MPSCVVKFCKNNTKVHKKCDGISFHTIPTKSKYRDKWVPPIRLSRNDPDWQPSTFSVVCSDHFEDKDMYETKRGLRRVTRTGYPKKNLFPPFNLNIYNDTLSSSVFSQSYPNIPLSVSVTENTVLPSTSSVIAVLSSSPGAKNDITLPPSTSSSPTIIDVPENAKYVDETSTVVAHKKEKVRKTLRKYQCKHKIKEREIISTQRKVTCHKNRNLTLKEIINNLKSQNFIDLDLYNLLSDNIGIVDLFNYWNRNKLKKDINYTPALKKFCLTLNYYSPKAYEYVKRTYNTCLPHLTTLSRWYGRVNGEPGFTEETFQALKTKSQAYEHRLICSLVLGEVALRTQKLWDGKKYIGLVDIGSGVDESAPLATQALVFLLVGINHDFKIPLGYFLIESISGEQKANLIKLCLLRCTEVNVDVISLAFDGQATNFTAVELLGCKFADSANIKSTFKHPANDSEVACFVDPSHVVKLIRNQFEAKKEFVDENNKTIAWQNVVRLNEIQNDASFNLSNKLTKELIHFRNQIVKVELATQLLSRNVATALKLCRENLKLFSFTDAEPTEKFIHMINNMFDVFNSKCMSQFELEKPLHLANKDLILTFLENLKKYVLNLKVKSVAKHKVVRNGRAAKILTRYYKTVVDAKCKRGFLSVLINIESLKSIYHKLVEIEKKLVHIPAYKLSQSHMEIMITSVRMLGDFNNDPNVRQFKGAYKKLLCYLKIRCLEAGYGVPLEDIAIFNCTSTAATIINTTTTFYKYEEQEYPKEQKIASLQFLRKIQEDTMELASTLNIANFKDLKDFIIGYIAGRTVHYISKLLKCEKCLEKLLSKDIHNFHKLITIRNKSGVCFPSQDVYNICVTCELVLRKLSTYNINFVRKSQHCYLVTQILELFTGNNIIFDDLENDHDYAGLGHKVNLLRLVIENYLSIRLYHISETNTSIVSAKGLKLSM